MDKATLLGVSTPVTRPRLPARMRSESAWGTCSAIGHPAHHRLRPLSAMRAQCTHAEPTRARAQHHGDRTDDQVDDEERVEVVVGPHVLDEGDPYIEVPDGAADQEPAGAAAQSHLPGSGG